jgi:hypothetical protein
LLTQDSDAITEAAACAIGWNPAGVIGERFAAEGSLALAPRVQLAAGLVVDVLIVPFDAASL